MKSDATTATPLTDRKSFNDMARMVQETKDQMAWDALQGVASQPTIKEQDFDCLRDFLVDMCSATLSESPPSQEEWDEIRKRTKSIAAEHALFHRDEQKAAKKSPRFFTARAMGLGKSILAAESLGSHFAGRSADLIVVDDITD